MHLANLATDLYTLGLPNNSRTYFLITSVLVALVILIETADVAHRSIAGMKIAGLFLAVFKVIATMTTVLTLALLPYERLRAVIFISLLVMGILTLYREFRRRLRAGDHSSSSYIGGITVVIQFLSMMLLAASGIAAILDMLLVPARLLASTRPLQDTVVVNWIELLATLLFSLMIYYILFYIGRRLLGSSSFSWIDPPNWRTLLPHLKYTQKVRLGIPPWRESDLADTVRKAYIQHVVGSNDLGAIIEAARIQPVAQPERGFTFAVLGDPGEGDASQIRPKTFTSDDLKEAMEAADTSPANPGFMVISSDVVYPAGELMDYERTLYRPYRVNDGEYSPLIYAIPGNHDWYNSLKGLFLNFGFAAAHGKQATDDQEVWSFGMRTGPWARYGWKWGDIRWREVAKLRDDYGLSRLGGDLDQPQTHQRLPFFELDFGDVPFVMLGVDTGCIGRIDDLQRAWLEARLQAAYDQEKIIAVVLSEPLYVNGAFADRTGLRSIYELLRRYEVQVVMGGDTHNYQHYEVRSITSRMTTHVAHHFVNGGGGAYITAPVDLNWRTPAGVTPIEPRFVYRDDAHQIIDSVMLKSFFPTAEDLRAKFSGDLANQAAWALKRWLIHNEPRLLAKGYTNALDHDRNPLLQSFVTMSMGKNREGWRLRVVPWFTRGANNELQPQPPIDIPVPNRAADINTRSLMPDLMLKSFTE